MNLLDLMVKIGVDDQASDRIGGLTSGMIAKATVVGNAFYDTAKFVGGKAVDMTKTFVNGAVEGYGAYEQLTGGMKKLYGDAASQVIADSQRAYNEVGISANKYMEGVAGFSAALKNSLGGDAKEAAELSNTAMKDIADNANTFGKYSVDELTQVYQALAKGQFQTLDNLNLGFGGTKEGMQQLIDKANELKVANGESADLTIDKFSDIVEAIHLVQGDMSITGTTMNEAMSTIEGSANSAKAAWENLLTGIGAGDQTMISDSVSGLVTSIFGTFEDETGKREGGLINNLIPVVQNVGSALLQEIPSIAERFVYTFIDTVGTAFGADTGWLDDAFYAFDDFTQRAGQAIDDFVSGFRETFKSDEFASAFEHISSAAGKAFDFITENADEFGAAFGVALDVIGAVADAVSSVVDVLGPFVPAIAGAVGALALLGPITGIVSTLSGAFTFFTTVIVPAMGMVQSFGGAIALVTTLLGGPIPILLAIGGAIAAFIATNEGARDAIVNAWDAVVQFFAGIPAWWDSVWVMVVDTVKGAVSDAIAKWVELREQASQIWEGVKTMVTTKALQLVASVVNKFNELKANAVAKFNEIKENITTAVQNAKDTAINAFQRLKDGVSEKINGVLGFVRSLPSKIKSALGNLGSLLWNAGSSVISGLLNGMKSAISGVYNWVSGIAGKIASLKGPLPYDRKVLVANGEALMTGLQKGLSIGFESDVKPYVESMAGQMGDALNVPSVSVGGGGTQKNGPTLNLTIGKMYVQDRDDAEYMARQINQIWKREMEGKLS